VLGGRRRPGQTLPSKRWHSHGRRLCMRPTPVSARSPTMDLLAALFPLGWAHYLAGGVAIGLGVAVLFLATGLIGGMSTVYSSTWSFVSSQPFFQQARFVESRQWRLVYALGLVLGAAVWWWMAGSGERSAVSLPWWQLLVGGLLVGFGARLSNGCTSGHGICGLGSLQLPSLLAVLVFMATAMATAWIVKIAAGGGA
jgi:uncharacterized protein